MRTETEPVSQGAVFSRMPDPVILISNKNVFKETHPEVHKGRSMSNVFGLK
jgi:hypothetical protein